MTQQHAPSEAIQLCATSHWQKAKVHQLLRGMHALCTLFVVYIAINVCALHCDAAWPELQSSSSALQMSRCSTQVQLCLHACKLQ